MQISDIRSQKLPRFYIRGNEIIYALADAFIEATLIKNRAVDFDISPRIASENHCVFDTLQKKFVDLLNLSDLPNLYKNGNGLFSQDDTLDYLQAKAELEKIVLNAYPSNPTPMANALLHYCNPDRHIHIFASEIKKRIVRDAPSLTKGTFTSSIDVDKASIDEIDDEICRIYDSIAKIDSYDVMMRKYFYKYST